MTTVDYISDVHCGWYAPFTTNQLKWKASTEAYAKSLLPEHSTSKIIVLAGDFSEQNAQTKWFIDTFKDYYDHVLVVFGNHDYYLLSKSQRKRYKNNSYRRINEIKDYYYNDPIVHILDNKVITLEGITFAGSTLWYKPTNQKDQTFYQHISNDSRCISIPLTEHQAEQYDVLHNRDMEFYNNLDHETIDVFISHVPPVPYEHSRYEYNSCYLNPVDTHQIPHWIAGHNHTVAEFTHDNTAFHYNMVGYPGENLSNKIKTFEVHSE